MLARWWLVLQAEVKSLCGHRKEGEQGQGASGPPHSSLSLPRATRALRGPGLRTVRLVSRSSVPGRPGSRITAGLALTPSLADCATFPPLGLSHPNCRRRTGTAAGLPCARGRDAEQSETLTTSALHSVRCGAGVRTAGVTAHTEGCCAEARPLRQECSGDLF